MAARLRAVKPGEGKAPPSSLVEAAASGDALAMYEFEREIVAKKCSDPNISGRDLAALTKRLGEIQRDIEALEAKRAQEADDGGIPEDAPFDSQAI